MYSFIWYVFICFKCKRDKKIKGNQIYGKHTRPLASVLSFFPSKASQYLALGLGFSDQFDQNINYLK